MNDSASSQRAPAVDPAVLWPARGGSLGRGRTSEEPNVDPAAVISPGWARARTGGEMNREGE